MIMVPLIPSASFGIASSEIHPNDVLGGRGCVISSHPGNEYFRMLIESKNVAYANSRSKREKTSITWSIIEEIKARAPPGRFLTKANSPRGKRKKNKDAQTWYEIDDTKAREKVAQALREKAPQLRHAIMPRQSAERRERSDGKTSAFTPQNEGKTAPPHFNGTENQQPHDNWKRPAMCSKNTSVASTVACPSNEDDNYLAHYADQHDPVAHQSSFDFAACIYSEKLHSSQWNADGGHSIVSECTDNESTEAACIFSEQLHSSQWNADGGHRIVSECTDNESTEASYLHRRKKTKVAVITRYEPFDSAAIPFSPICF